MNHYSVKQVIVVRTLYPDGKGGLRKIRSGKIASQAAHASIAFLTYNCEVEINNGENFLVTPISEYAYEWIKSSFAKICLQVDTEEELIEIYNKAKEAGMEVHLITDNGTTEFDRVPTKTCLAIGPHKSEEIDRITGHLRLL